MAFWLFIRQRNATAYNDGDEKGRRMKPEKRRKVEKENKKVKKRKMKKS